jgi:hypothetical protein
VIPVSEIAMRAYYIWEAEGRPEGRDIDHWLRAESELALMAAATVTAADPPSQTSNSKRRSRER